MTDVVAISTNLLIAYGAMILVTGAAVGIIIGRSLRPRPTRPGAGAPEDLKHRIERLELDADRTHALLKQLVNRPAPARELRQSEPRARAA
jgi:hypothetical protein